ncbi:MAG: hypothetical protein JW703_04655 [Candidatus Diapherotrites archaeon]|nr:hypothetical protein [Candidatus Diapherotrites archaeon]
MNSKIILFTALILIISINVLADFPLPCDYSGDLEVKVINSLTPSCEGICPEVYFYSIDIGSGQLGDYRGTNYGDYYAQIIIEANEDNDFTSGCFSTWAICYILGNSLCKPEEDILLDLFIDDPFVAWKETLKAEVIVYNNSLNPITVNKFEEEIKSEDGSSVMLLCGWELTAPGANIIPPNESKTYVCNITIPDSIEQGNYSLKISLPETIRNLESNSNKGNDSKKKFFTVAEAFEPITVPETDFILVIVTGLLVLGIIAFKSKK